MAVAFDAVGPSSAGAGSLTATDTWTHVSVGTTGLAGIVSVAFGSGSTATMAFTLGVTWGGVAMTSLGKVATDNSTTAGYVQMFGIIAPPTGSQTITVTCTGGTPNSLAAGSISFTGVGSFGTAVTAFGSSAAATVSVTGTSVNNMMVSAVCAGSAISGAGTGVTSRWIKNESTSSGAGEGAGGTSPSVASGAVAMPWTISGSDFWGMIGVEAIASATGANVRGVTGAAASGSSFTIAETAAGPLAGDIRYLFLHVSAFATLTIPTGWTTIYSDVGTDSNLYVLSRAWVAGVGSQTISLTASTYYAYELVAVSGVNTGATPQLVSNDVSGGTAITATGLTPTVTSGLLLAFFAVTYSSGATTKTLTLPTGMTAVDNHAATTAVGTVERIASKPITSLTATGNFVSTASATCTFYRTATIIIASSAVVVAIETGQFFPFF